MTGPARALLAFLLLASSKAGAAGAGLTGSLLTAGVVTGQVPVPEGVPTWLAAILVGIPPALAWLFTRLVASMAASRRVRGKLKRERAQQMLEAGDHSAESGPIIRQLINESIEDESTAAGLEAWQLPRTSA